MAQPWSSSRMLTETKKRGHLIIWGAFSACLEKDASGVFSVPVRCFWSLGSVFGAACSSFQVALAAAPRARSVAKEEWRILRGFRRCESSDGRGGRGRWCNGVLGRPSSSVARTVSSLGGRAGQLGCRPVKAAENAKVANGAESMARRSSAQESFRRVFSETLFGLWPLFPLTAGARSMGHRILRSRQQRHHTTSSRQPTVSREFHAPG